MPAFAYQVTFQIHMPNPNTGPADLYRRDPVAVICVASAGDPATLQAVILSNIPALVAGEVLDLISIEQLVYGNRPLFQ